MASSTSVVLAAMVANGALAVLKFLGFLLTGSPAMLSETYHSISDTGNQIFLLVGLRFGARKATREHPFGYGKAQFFYSFLVSVMLFGIAGWESAKHGYHAIVAGESVALHGTVTVASFSFPAVWVNYGVLLGGMVFEAYAFAMAFRATKADIRRHGWAGFGEAFRKTSNTTTLTALTEDTIALLGLGIAFLGVLGTQVTGNPLFDAIAAFLIGLLLMGFAVALAWENKRLLLGESLPEAEENLLRSIVENWAGVSTVIDFRTVYFGPEEVIVTADVEFEGELDTETMDETISAIEDELRRRDEAVSKVYIEPEY